MSTLSDVSKISEGIGNEQHQSLAIEAVRTLTSREGGLNSLVQAFEQNGLGHIISSWIGNGENAAISAEQIKGVLGSEWIANLAKKAGIPADKAAQYLSTSLPNLVDSLTPNGSAGSANDLLSRGKEVLAAITSVKQTPRKGGQDGPF